jgi:N-methylhydantoinase A
LVVSPRRRDVQRTVVVSGDELTAEAVAEIAAELGEDARRQLDDSKAELNATYELRYSGQAFELPIAAGREPTIDELREAFESEHERRYGYSDSEQRLELVTVRVTGTVPGPEIALTADEDPRPGTKITGPERISLPESTLLVPEGWAGIVDDNGTIKLTRRAR